jgi:hypothetical protein
MLSPALIIAQQIKANRVTAMTGAKIYTVGEDALNLYWKQRGAGRPANKAAFTTIAYDSSRDLYDIEHFRFSKKAGFTSIQKHCGVFAEDMKRIIEDDTQLFLSF